MDSLWLAVAIYSVGMAAVLWVRPALMFNENGTAKEFGYQRTSRHTLFPVWLFAIVWAFVSYAVASAVLWIGMGGGEGAATVGMMAATTAARPRWSPSEGLLEEVEEDEGEGEGEEEDFTIPISRVPRRVSGGRKPRPGYYVVDPMSEESGGLRRYVYYGDRPPV